MTALHGEPKTKMSRRTGAITRRPDAAAVTVYAEEVGWLGSKDNNRFFAKLGRPLV
jgi:hypothetical protein